MAWTQRLLGCFRSRKLHREIDEELRFHLERRLQDQLAGGLSTPEARRALRQRFGDLDRLQERTHDMDILTWLATWLQDLKQAVRMMRRAPAFTAIVVLSLALGIGANAAIFSLINAVLLRTLPVPAPQQIFLLSHTDGVNQPSTEFSYPVLQEMIRAAGAGAELGGASSISSLPLPAAAGTTHYASTQLVSAGYFTALGIQPWRGRWINADDNRALGASPVAVLSYGFWMTHFGGDAGVLGHTLSLHGTSLAIVGIAPAGFDGLDPGRTVDVWAPLMMQAALRFQGNAWSHDGDSSKPWPPQEQMMWLDVFARLPQPADSTQIAAALTPAIEASFQRLRETALPHRVLLAAGGRGGDSLRKAYGAPLLALMTMVGLMLLIAVANVATLLLARMVSRRREIAIRMAVGVSRARLARQFLTEGLLLAAIAASAAVAVAYWGSRLLLHLAAGGKGAAPFAADLDWRVWGFLAGVALLAGLLIGLLPAWQASRRGVADVLKSSNATTPGGERGGRLPFGRWLVIVQVALSLLLVAGAGLFSRSLAAMFHQDLGFDRTHILTVQVNPPDPDLPAAEWPVLDQQLLERVGALPGVRAAALAQSGLDDYSTDTSGISLAGRVDPPGGLSANENTVSEDYFAAVGMHLVRGRGFLATDGPQTPVVVVVNQAFVRRFYADQNPLGKTFGYGPTQTSQFQIVGVAADARVHDPHEAAVPMFYRLASQSGNPALILEVRTSGDPLALSAAVRSAVTGTDTRLRVRSTSSLAARLDDMLLRDRLIAQLSGGFGILALALACLGLFGVMSYAVAARSPEFGIRMALGAARSNVLGLVLREASLLVAGGLVIGLPLTLWAAHAVQPLLPGIHASDPTTLAAAIAVMAALPLLAALKPAWRATRVDPARALRAD